VLRYRISYSKEGPARYMSHLDLVRAFERGLRRAGLPVSLSQGFNPHSRLSFGFPLPVGVAGLEEYVDIELEQEVSPEGVVSSLNQVLPQGIKTGGCRLLEDKSPALMAEVERAHYLVRIRGEAAPGLEMLENCLAGIMGRAEITVTRRKKDGRAVPFDIRPGLLGLSARLEEGRPVVEMDLISGSALNIRPAEVVSALRDQCGLPEDLRLEITRTGIKGSGGRDLSGVQIKGKWNE